MSTQPNFWDDPQEAERIMREIRSRKAWTNSYEQIQTIFDDLSTLWEFLEAGEASEEEVDREYEKLEKALEDVEFRKMLSGEEDQLNAMLEINSGAGGTESQDWASMLMRMYVRWAEAHGYKVEWIEETEGEGAGIKSATVVVKGHNAYGWLKSENGVHRLVRISPFDANARRHTSFASVTVYPVVDDRIKIDIKESDVRTDVMRSGGAGGQHVNKTESAVRLTHIPTNIVVKCQSDRSQHRNRSMAWDMLRAKLFEVEMKKREEKAAAEQAAKTDIGWGHQIRSYVLQPYQMVKDLRTGVSTSNTAGVLDGDLDEFMQAALAQKAFGGAPEQVEDVD